MTLGEERKRRVALYMVIVVGNTVLRDRRGGFRLIIYEGEPVTRCLMIGRS